MLISLLVIFLLTLGGLGATYLIADDESLLWRLCAGNVVGSVIFGLVCFLVACLFGFTAPTILLSLLISLLPLLLFVRESNRADLLAGWQKARTSLDSINRRKILSFAYYFGILIVLWWFFDRAVFETKDGIFTGGSHNLGDLAFHLGAIFSFSDGQNFPPENPSYAFAKFTYPFIVDLIAASFVRLGASARGAIYMQDVWFVFSLVVLLERFTFKFTGNRLASKIAPLILLFSGGLGFAVFFWDFWQQGKGFFDFLYNMPGDYTINNNGFRWGNTLTSLFLTQRSFLLGMPLTVIALQKLWEVFTSRKEKSVNRMPTATDGDREELNDGEEILQNKTATSKRVFPFSMFVVGLLVGNLPLIHAHSLAALFIITAFLFFFRLDKWREWLAFGAGVSVIAIPELLWAMTGSATRLTEFIAWKFGWDKREGDFFVFWTTNLGLFLPLLLIGLYPIFEHRRREIERREKAAEQRLNGTEASAELRVAEDENTERSTLNTQHLIFYLPFIILFIITNVMKLAPWEWDNIKVLIYWFVGSIPFVALVLAKLWEKNRALKFVAAACLIGLTFAGILDVWRVVTKQINFNVFSKDSVTIAGQIKQKTESNAMFLNASTYNSTVVLSGRRSLLRFSGHLSSYGIDYGPREEEMKKIYEGSPQADALLQKNKIEYVVVSPEERANVKVNDNFFKKFPVLAEVGQYRIYQVRK